jgi:ABC-type Na+ efflux pump permease subunit
MFKNIDTLMKTIFAILMLLFVGLFVWHGYSNEKKVTTLTVTNAAQERTITNQGKAIDTQAKVATITEAANVAVQEKTKQLVKKQDVVTTRLDQRTNAIVQEFASKPSTVVNEVAKQEKLSLARIDSLWESYCIDTTNLPECQPITDGENHA